MSDSKERIKVILQKCTGCKLCIKACPFSAITVKDKKAIIDYDKCTLCGACKEVCKFEAIEVLQTEQKTGSLDISKYKDDLEKNYGVEFKGADLPISITIGYRFALD